MTKQEALLYVATKLASNTHEHLLAAVKDPTWKPQAKIIHAMNRDVASVLGVVAEYDRAQLLMVEAVEATKTLN